MSEYGVSLNYSHIVKENGDVEAGLHLKNTDGKDIEVSVEGDNLEEVLTELYLNTIDELVNPTEEDKEEESLDAEFLLAENEQLREEVMFLRGLIKDNAIPTEEIDSLRESFDEVCDENDLLWKIIDDQEDDIYSFGTECIIRTLEALDPSLDDLLNIMAKL